MNSQPLRIVLVRSPEARERLVQHMAPGNRARTLAAPLVAVLATDLDFHDESHRTFPVFPGARDAYADEERRTRAAYSSALLQAGYFIVGVRAAGLAAGPMEGLRRRRRSRRSSSPTGGTGCCWWSTSASPRTRPSAPASPGSTTTKSSRPSDHANCPYRIRRFPTLRGKPTLCTGCNVCTAQEPRAQWPRRVSWRVSGSSQPARSAAPRRRLGPRPRPPRRRLEGPVALDLQPGRAAAATARRQGTAARRRRSSCRSAGPGRPEALGPPA